jgi:hypothetical protein
MVGALSESDSGAVGVVSMIIGELGSTLFGPPSQLNKKGDKITTNLKHPKIRKSTSYKIYDWQLGFTIKLKDRQHAGFTENLYLASKSIK